MKEIIRVDNLLKRLSINILGGQMKFTAHYDKLFQDILRLNGEEPRIYIQITYSAPDTKDPNNTEMYKGAKWYLSPHMTDDEIVKKCYLAFRTCVEHEVLEGFKVDDIILFNPHVDFEELLKVSHKEVTRKQKLEIY